MNAGRIRYSTNVLRIADDTSRAAPMGYEFSQHVDGVKLFERFRLISGILPPVTLDASKHSGSVIIITASSREVI